MYSNLKIVPLLIERETPCSLFSDESPKREKKESLFVREEKTHFTTLSLSLFSSSSALFSLCGFRAFFLSLFFKSYYEGEDGKKNEERKKERNFAFVLKPYTLNSFFFKFNDELISRAKLNLLCKRRHNTHFARIPQNIYTENIYIYI